MRDLVEEGLVEAANEIAALQSRVKQLEEALRKAVQLASIASDWNLYEVEIDDEMVPTYTLGGEWQALLNGGSNERD